MRVGRNGRMARRLRLLAGTAAVAMLGTGCERREEAVQATGPPPSKPSVSEQKRFDDLTIPFIMQGPGIVGTSPSRTRFSADGAYVYFHWNSPVKLDSLNALHPDSAYDHYVRQRDDAGYYVLDVGEGSITKLSDEAADSLVPESGAWNYQRSRRAEIRNGDLYLVDRLLGTTRRVTATLARERDVHVSYNGDVVHFVRDGNVYSIVWEGGPIRQLTDLRLADEPAEKEESAQREYLVEQQKTLFEDFRRPEEEDDVDRPAPVYLGAGWVIDEIRVSPTGRFAAVELSREPAGARKPLVPHFITRSGYMETTETRPKVGDLREAARVEIVDLRGDSLVEFDVDEAMAVTLRSWSPSKDVLLVRAITDDHNARYFFTITPQRRRADGSVVPRVVDVYEDDAWVGGPAFYSTGGWLPDGSAVYFLSEKSGFSHLYTVPVNGSQPRMLTNGRWEVYSARPSHDGSRWFLVTNEGDSGSQRLWTMRRDGTGRRLLTPEAGRYRPVYAPDESVIAVRRSTINRPPELYLFDTDGESLRGPLTESTTALYRAYAWVRPEVVTIRASDRQTFRAHIFRPETFGKRPNGAGIVFIHGAGYLQNVNNWWSYYYREYMFNHFLASRGYTVLNVDFRGSAGYGRECRVAVHGHMGGRDLDDVIDAARYLVSEAGVEAHRVGVYGGSYGGFLAIMALFKYPDVVTCGAALRSVTDWAHYNHWYTSRILGTPEENPEAYERSSPIHFADGFEGGLLMLHGLVDSNVLAADVLRLSQVLIELGKEDWDLVLYPLEGHAFERASSWSDEYRRIFELFEEKLAPAP